MGDQVKTKAETDKERAWGQFRNETARWLKSSIVGRPGPRYQPWMLGQLYGEIIAVAVQTGHRWKSPEITILTNWLDLDMTSDTLTPERLKMWQTSLRLKKDIAKDTDLDAIEEKYEGKIADLNAAFAKLKDDYEAIIFRLKDEIKGLRNQLERRTDGKA